MTMMPFGGNAPSARDSRGGPGAGREVMPFGTRPGARDDRRGGGGGGGGGREMLPFGAPGGFFGGRDPFAEFGGLEAFGGLGAGFGGSLMAQFEDMARGMGAGPGDSAAMRGGGGNGQYVCQTFAMSSHMGPDGKMHTEQYSSSDVGNTQQKIRESQQAYSNSTTGIDKMGLERQLGDRARKVVKERHRGSMEERSTEMFRGMDEGGAAAFDRDFGAHSHHVPQHPPFDARRMLAAGAPSGRALGGGGGGGGRPPSGRSAIANGRARSMPRGR